MLLEVIGFCTVFIGEAYILKAYFVSMFEAASAKSAGLFGLY